MNKEIWKPIKGYNGLYEISNLGNVKSFKISKYGNRMKLNIIGKRYWVNGDIGYYSVGLYKNSKRTSRKVHSLVLEAFVGSRIKGYVANHKDGNNLNNVLSNLEYVTLTKNAEHAFKIGLRKPPKRSIHLTRKGLFVWAKSDKKGFVILRYANSYAEALSQIKSREKKDWGLYKLQKISKNKTLNHMKSKELNEDKA